jgi:hypothetical protein
MDGDGTTPALSGTPFLEGGDVAAGAAYPVPVAQSAT